MMTVWVLMATGLAASAQQPGDAPEAQASGDAPDFESRTRELQDRIAALDAIDPLQPEVLNVRLDYARLLHQESTAECLPHLQTAEQVLAPVLGADASETITWPDGPGDALSLLQTIQNTQGRCAKDEAVARTAFEAAIRSGERAVELLRENWDFEEMAIAQFNIAFARYELGDLDGALRDLEQVLDWDQEFGFRDELETDYATWLRWRNGEEPDPDEVDRFVTSFNQTKARFQFVWRPHRSHWSTEASRVSLKSGELTEVTTRYETQVDARRDGEDWVIATTLDAVPTFQANGAIGAAGASEGLQSLIGSLAAALPEMVIAADGTFKSLRNLEQHRANLLHEVKRMLTAGPQGVAATSAAEAERAVATLLSPDLLTTLAEGQWDIAVGAWIGGEFDHGDWYTLTFAEPLPGFTDKPVSKTMNFKVSRWLPCAPGGEPECVEVLVKITADVAAMSDAIADFVARVMPAASQAELKEALLKVDYEFDLRYRLVTDPDTLRPWSLEERKYIYVSSLEGGKRRVQARHERTVETGRYADRLCGGAEEARTTSRRSPLS